MLAMAALFSVGVVADRKGAKLYGKHISREKTRRIRKIGMKDVDDGLAQEIAKFLD